MSRTTPGDQPGLQKREFRMVNSVPTRAGDCSVGGTGTGWSGYPVAPLRFPVVGIWDVDQVPDRLAETNFASPKLRSESIR